MNKSNKIVKNRVSPANEEEYIELYKSANPKAVKQDGLDIAAVISKDGTRGHALMKPKDNRSRDKNYHRGIDFIADEDLKKKKKKSN